MKRSHFTDEQIALCLRQVESCGITLGPHSEIFTVEHQGVKRYFYSKASVEKFENDPESYLQDRPAVVGGISGCNQHEGGDEACPAYPQAAKDRPCPGMVSGMAHGS
jgi:YHS domain-containing protein